MIRGIFNLLPETHSNVVLSNSNIQQELANPIGKQQSTY